MDPELQKQHEHMEAYDMIVHLRQLYQEQARHERFDVSNTLFQAKLTEGSPVGPHVLNMIGYVETLGRLGFPLGQELATDLILQSLPSSYSQFVMNYNMNDYNKPLPELLGMLRTAEQDISKGTSVLMVQGTKKKGKGKKKDILSSYRGSSEPIDDARISPKMPTMRMTPYRTRKTQLIDLSLMMVATKPTLNRLQGRLERF
ncbi:hypothetical protein CRG98_028404 [Punica granatum]|uniref:Retrotransposon gag domain-containing protein n=1 Tax=Punica granatum TaxID=22663 RepID=A0A2I0J4N4_PUNGR|nr:hypothetical protein CRG98_028404 [Punica granatum]